MIMMVAALLFVLMATAVFAGDPNGSETLAADPSTPFTFIWMMVCGILVFFMQAGFALVEAGFAQAKNTVNILTKNFMDFCIGGLAFFFFGYGLMYGTDIGGFIGSDGFLLLGNYYDVSQALAWFFQMVFVATSASIVSGTLAERIKLWPFLVFVVLLTGFIYPIAGSWQWGHGWLYKMGFSDFAGSTLVHSVGGWAALTGALLLGARKGKYSAGGVTPMPGSSIPLATLGTFILWLGWFGFNGASQLAMGTIGDASDVSRIFANTNLAAAGGVVAVMILMPLIYGKVDVTMVLNGALAGLVSITAEPLNPSPFLSIIIGAVGGIIVVFAVPAIDKLKIDDVVGAIPVHLLAGIWGTFIVPLSNGDASFGVQIIGILAYGVFTVVVSAVFWLILKAVMGIRVSDEEEAIGLDKAEVGVEAYPEFTAAGTRF